MFACVFCGFFLFLLIIVGRKGLRDQVVDIAIAKCSEKQTIHSQTRVIQCILSKESIREDVLLIWLPFEDRNLFVISWFWELWLILEGVLGGVAWLSDICFLKFFFFAFNVCYFFWTNWSLYIQKIKFNFLKSFFRDKCFTSFYWKRSLQSFIESWSLKLLFEREAFKALKKKRNFRSFQLKERRRFQIFLSKLNGSSLYKTSFSIFSWTKSFSKLLPFEKLSWKISISKIVLKMFSNGIKFIFLNAVQLDL